MKTIFTFLFLSLCCNCIHLTAQTNYYPETKTFHENGYTYQCDVDEASMVSLYNMNSLRENRRLPENHIQNHNVSPS